MLLAEVLGPRRADVAGVIGAGLEIAALGMGHRQVAAHLGRAKGTVRGWLRAFAGRAEEVRRHFTVALVALVQGYYGLTRIPFGRSLAPSMLHQHHSHKEAAARIAWCIDNRAIGVVTGEVGAGKTVALKGAVSMLDPARFTVMGWDHRPLVGARGGVLGLLVEHRVARHPARRERRLPPLPSLLSARAPVSRKRRPTGRRRVVPAVGVS